MAQSGDWSVYEWDVEEVLTTDDDGDEISDVIDHNFQFSAAECVSFIRTEKPMLNHRFDIVLVLDDQDQRSWAYVDMETLTLPEHFENAIGNKTRKVPKRFHEEIAKATKSVV